MSNHTSDLIECWKNSPFPSTKISTYFAAYGKLFSKYRNTKCTFIETGVLGGGSLFMWRSWLGSDAKIIGVDLNPSAARWREHGFEIYIGDQGDPKFWQETYPSIGNFDVLLDDGGHQSFQQIVTLNEAIKHAKKDCIIAIEDTHTSFMSDFKAHGEATFLNYAKDSTDVLTAKAASMYPDRMRTPTNIEILNLFRSIQSIEFFTSLVAFKIDPNNSSSPSAVWNKREGTPSDFRYNGINEATVMWPDPFTHKETRVSGGQI
jgi:hypothetical protein